MRQPGLLLRTGTRHCSLAGSAHSFTFLINTLQNRHLLLQVAWGLPCQFPQNSRIHLPLPSAYLPFPRLEIWAGGGGPGEAKKRANESRQASGKLQGLISLALPEQQYADSFSTLVKWVIFSLLKEGMTRTFLLEMFCFHFEARMGLENLHF